MATTIGRVEFLVGLDGSRLPQQAQRLADQIAAAGTRGGNQAGQNVESAFDRSLTRIGRQAEQRLAATGRLAGRRFSEDFDDIVSNRFQRMQRNLAEILTDRDTFLEFARGFDDVGHAANQLQADLDALVGVQTDWVDANGEVQRVNVLARGEYQQMSGAIRQFGRDAETTIEAERDLTRQTEEMDATLRRAIRTIGDVDVFRQFAAEVGGTEHAFQHFGSVLEDTGAALGRSRGDIEEWVDTLERTRRAADEADRQMALLEHRPGALQRAFSNLGEFMAKPFTSLDNDVRLVIGIIASGAGEIAVLGSAIGAGLVAVGGAAAQAAIGAVAFGVVFSRLNSDLEDLPANLRPVAREFQLFKGVFGDLADLISRSAFQEMPLTFASLDGSVRQLFPAFSDLGSVIGKTFDKFAQAVKPGSDQLHDINTLVRRSASGFEDLMGTLGTFGSALVRAFNRGQPLIEDLFGWVDKLAHRFDDFTRSSDFTDWITNAQKIFGSLGGLIDAVGESLNNLATPKAVDQTTALLDNLTDFMPALTGILDVVGRLDPLGLFAQLLADIGDAVMPLIEPLGRLADALNVQLATAIESLAGILEPAIAILGPFVDLLADLVTAIPPGAIDMIAAGLVALGAAALTLNAANGLGAMSARLTEADGAMSGFAGAAGRAGRGLETLSRVIGLGGLIVGGITAGAFAARDFARELMGLDDIARNVVGSQQTIATAIKKVDEAGERTQPRIINLREAMKGLETAQNPVAGWLAGFSEVGSAATVLHNTLQDLDGPLAAVAASDPDQAAVRFKAFAAELGATHAQSLVMLGSMEKYKESLIATSIATGGMGTDQEILAIALGEVGGAASGAATGVDSQIDALVLLQDQAMMTSDEVDTLSDKIRNFGNTQLDTRDASRQYEQSLIDLTAKLTENGATLDLTTQAGIDNSAALDDVIKGVNEHAASVFTETKNQDAANAVLATGRQRLEEMIRAFDPAGLAAGNYSDILNDIPDTVQTVATVEDTQAQNDIAALTKTRYLTIKASIQTDKNGQQFIQMQGGKTLGASGGLFNKATDMIIGEAGPEALVPLNRPLHMVDPAVRELSAIAQGMRPKPVASNVSGTGGPTRVLNVAPGAIVIQGDRAPETTATNVVNRLAQRLAG